MAKVTVTGEVEEVKQTTTGKILVKIVETYLSQSGENWLRKWSLWMPASFKLDEVAKDDVLEIEGDLSTKVVEWVNGQGVTKQIMDHNLNNIRILKHETKAEYVRPFNDDEDDRRKYGTGLAPF